MICYFRSRVLLVYSSSITLVDIQCCLPILIEVQICQFSVPVWWPHIMLNSLVCITTQWSFVLSFSTMQLHVQV
jgi:hypothetical protein